MFFYIIMFMFKFVALYLTGFMVAGTIIGIFPLNEIFTLVVPAIMWLLSTLIKKLFGFQNPEFLNTKVKKTIACLVVLALGVASVF